jgi:hypothetical protein
LPHVVPLLSLQQLEYGESHYVVASS